MRVAKGKSITLHDAQQVTRFRFELGMVADLEREGHSHNCAKFQVFESRPCSCRKEPK